MGPMSIWELGGGFLWVKWLESGVAVSRDGGRKLRKKKDYGSHCLGAIPWGAIEEAEEYKGWS